MECQNDGGTIFWKSNNSDFNKMILSKVILKYFVKYYINNKCFGILFKKIFTKCMCQKDKYGIRAYVYIIEPKLKDMFILKI